MLVGIQFIGEFLILSRGNLCENDKLSRKNELRVLVLSEKLCFLNDMMCSANSVVEVFIHSVELCNFACVSPYDSKAKIKLCVSAKYATNIVS